MYILQSDSKAHSSRFLYLCMKHFIYEQSYFFKTTLGHGILEGKKLKNNGYESIINSYDFIKFT